MNIEFSVPGDPRGKSRPRFVSRGLRGKTHTPEETAIYENLIRMEYRRQCGSQAFTGGAMLDLRVLAYFAIPKSVSRKKHLLMISGDIRPTKTPDYDNIAKIVSDSLNGVAYRDDAQIVDALVSKFYSDIPRIEVKIQELL